jgi:Meiotically up-regulated gene 113
VVDLTDEEMLAELGIDIEAKKLSAHTPQEERIIAGFEDIQRFGDEHKRFPAHGEGLDIFERLYAVRLDRLRAMPESRLLLASLDRQGLLYAEQRHGFAEGKDDEALLAELGIDIPEDDDIRQLRHVKSNAEKQAAEEIANRTKCEDFEKFAPLFEQVQRELQAGIRETRPFELKSEIEVGRLFVVGGQKAYVAEKGKVFSNAQGRLDARLRVIFDNGTESNMLMRSLQRSLHKDEAGRRITEPSAGPLFEAVSDHNDTESGTIYVLRSLSNEPAIGSNRDLIHKIGVTYLLADVEVIATYELFNINRAKLEKLIHRFFTPARIDLEIPDRFGNLVRPREWYLVPLAIIDEAVAKIRDGSVVNYSFDPKSASLVPR